MSRNLLPFEWDEARRYGMSWQLLRNVLLRWSQSRAFRKADGLIFLTEYARSMVQGQVKDMKGRSTIIPHGVDTRFFRPVRCQKPMKAYS